MQLFTLVVVFLWSNYKVVVLTSTNLTHGCCHQSHVNDKLILDYGT